MKRAALLLLVVLAQPAQAADVLPRAVHGLWSLEREACAQQASEAQMTVEPRIILFYEVAFEIRRVTRRPDGSYRVTGFTVTDDGRAPDVLALKLVARDRLRANEQVYERCPNRAR